MSSKYVIHLLRTLAIVVLLSAKAYALPVQAENEPNNSPATAKMLLLNGGRAIGSGSITPGDVDWWGITGIAPNSKIWAYVDTGGPQGAGNSRDSFLTLYAADGATVLEFDDDDGTSNGLDESRESPLGSAIAGRVLTTGGTYYLAINEFTALSTIDPYRIYIVVTPPGLDVPESEPNNNMGSSNVIISPGNMFGVRTGSLDVPGDIDTYSFSANAGDILFLSADGDPSRGGVGTDIALTLYNQGGIFLVSCDNSAEGDAENPPGEACGFQVSATGTYFLTVTHSFDFTGPYSVMVANMTPSVITAGGGAQAETEPNETAVTATRLLLNGGRGTGGGSILSNDNDYWRLDGITTGASIWAYVDTGGAQQGGATTRDSLLTLLATDGTTVIETDDDDGTGNGLDGIVESGNASAIAGGTVGPAGSYYLHARAKTAGQVLNPYRIYVVATPATLPAPEVEPNDNAGAANAIVSATTVVGVRTGAIGVAGDVDYYSATMNAGDTIFLALDADPARTGTGSDLTLTLFNTDGTTQLLACNPSGTGSGADPAGAACAYQLTTAGTYYVRVSHASGTGTGPYRVMVANMTSMLTLDIDASNAQTTYDPRTDGLLVLRYLSGFTETSLTADATGGTATRNTSAIQAYLDQLKPTLDVDGNGASDALTDGMLIVRYLSGLRGSALMAGVVGQGAARSTAAQIEAYLQTLTP